MAPARTGKDRRRRIEVSRTLHTNKGIRSNVTPSPRMLIMVERKLADPKMLLTPAMWREKMTKSTAPPPCPTTERGGYTVQPVPAPLSTMPEHNNRTKAGGSNQNLILFIRGNAISGAFNINGTSQLPNPPIIVGITKKKIIMKACDVTMTLYN